MPSILILETSTEICSVALIKDGRLIDIKESDQGQNHARLVTVFAEELLKKNNMNADELSAITVSKGPGSYTGLRIGVSVAKGICFANNIPLIAISTLDAMAFHVVSRKHENHFIRKDALFCPMMDARRMEVYTSLFNSEGVVIKPVSAMVIDESSFAQEMENHQIVFFGNGADKCKTMINHQNALFLDDIFASSKYMVQLACEAYNNNIFEDVAYFEPYYLKDFIATMPKNKIIG